ncbi:MAG: F0F1 ATP synthase subunit delta [Candidatus Omnitrophica bacterium]|nr:F0F1 ATP synthase subunit delta [Candidatus Omnitrophota bacterium]
MLIVSLVVIQVIIFVVLFLFLRSSFNKNVISATTHLEQLSQEYTKKQEQIKNLYEEAKRQTQEIIESSRKDAEKQREQILKDAQLEKERILNTAHQQANEIVEQADKARKTLLSEIEKKIEERAIQRAGDLLNEILPLDLRQQIHQHWIEDLLSAGFQQLERLHIPEGITEAELITAFALEPIKKEVLIKKIQERLNRQLNFKEKVDEDIIAGLIVNIGNLVFDGSLRLKLQELINAKQST